MKSSTTYTTIPTTTVYTTAKQVKRAEGFPSILLQASRTLSCACSTLLARHAKITTSTAHPTTVTVVSSAPPVIHTSTRTLPPETLYKTTTSKTTATDFTISETVLTNTFSVTSTVTSTRYLATRTLPAQCAPSAYVGVGQTYVDDSSINFVTAPNQPDAVGCCLKCYHAGNCQAWVFYGNTDVANSGTFGDCVLVSGTGATCPAKTVNMAFYPGCEQSGYNGFDVGLGSCASDIDLTAGGCILGENPPR